MADIAFLLLIFFLVATTMNVDSGIQRVLPPLPPPDMKQEDQVVKERNVLLVFVSKFNNIMVGKEVMDISQLKDKVKDFVLNINDAENLPEKKIETFDIIGDYPVSQGVVSLQNDRGTSYNTYMMVQNELTRAFNEIRDELSMREFGKNFLDLDEERRGIVQKAIPLKISEAEPRSIQ